MLNQVVVVGKVKLIDTKANVIVINCETKEDTDNLIGFEVSNNIMKNCKEYLKVNDVVGIKGHLEYNKIKVDKVTFLTNHTK